MSMYYVVSDEFGAFIGAERIPAAEFDKMRGDLEGAVKWVSSSAGKGVMEARARTETRLFESGELAKSKLAADLLVIDE